MKVYFNAFWGGFVEKTDAVHCQFFIDLFQKIWNEPIELGDKESSDILCESIFGVSALKDKPWKYSVLFSGESRLQKDPIDHLYTFVLYGQRNNGNRINVPLFLPYLYGNNFFKTLESLTPRTSIPQNAVLVVITNPNGATRNKFLEALEKRVPVCYAGHYKNNIGGTIAPPYYSPEFRNFVANFKCVVTMENSREDTYITEKICHGFLAQTVPIYWGSPRVYDYFNKERFLCVENEEDIEKIVENVALLMQDNEKWLSMVNQPVFPGGNLWRTVDTVAYDCRNLLADHVFKPIEQTYLICKQEFEKERYERLKFVMKYLALPTDSYTFLCATYKNTITDSEYEKYVRTPMKNLLPWVDRKLRKSELSLILNLYTILAEIDKQYLDGIFLILESDVVPKDDSIDKLPKFLEEVYRMRNEWECIHIGHGSEDQLWKTPFTESLTKGGDTIRLSRHLNTRCTDSMLWTKQGIEKMLKYMRKTEDYSEPLDHYMSRYFEENQDTFRFFWSQPTFFVQLSNYGSDTSTIQTDKV